MDSPLVLKCNTKISDFIQGDQMQVVLANFAATYKKTGKQQLAVDGRSQMPLFAKEGKEESTAFFDFAKSMFPEKSFIMPDAFKGLLSQYWLYGYMPTMRNIANVPNGLPVFRMLLKGEVVWILLEVSTLCAAIDACRTAGTNEAWMPTANMSVEDLVKSIGLMDDTALKTLKEKGARIQHVVQAQDTLLYVPTAWFVAERVSKGLLVYGVRHTACMRSEKAGISYKKLIDLSMVSGKKDTSNMQALSDCAFS